VVWCVGVGFVLGGGCCGGFWAGGRCVSEEGYLRTPLLPLKISNKLKKISYDLVVIFFCSKSLKNLLPKWSVFVRVFYKNNSISFFFVADIYLFYLRYLFVFIFFIWTLVFWVFPLFDVLYLNVFYNVVCNKSNHNRIKYFY